MLSLVLLWSLAAFLCVLARFDIEYELHTYENFDDRLTGDKSCNHGCEFYFLVNILGNDMSVISSRLLRDYSQVRAPRGPQIKFIPWSCDQHDHSCLKEFKQTFSNLDVKPRTMEVSVLVNGLITPVVERQDASIKFPGVADVISMDFELIWPEPAMRSSFCSASYDIRTFEGYLSHTNLSLSLSFFCSGNQIGPDCNMTCVDYDDVELAQYSKCNDSTDLFYCIKLHGSCGQVTNCTYCAPGKTCLPHEVLVFERWAPHLFIIVLCIAIVEFVIIIFVISVFCGKSGHQIVGKRAENSKRKRPPRTHPRDRDRLVKPLPNLLVNHRSVHDALNPVYNDPKQVRTFPDHPSRGAPPYDQGVIKSHKKEVSV